MAARAFVVMFLAGCLAVGCDGTDKKSQPAPSSAAPTTFPTSPELIVGGNATLDGAALDAQFLGAVVRRDDLITPCQADIGSVVGGKYEIAVLAETQAKGCGVPGAQVMLWTFANGTKLYSASFVAWPPQGNTAPFAVSFSAAHPNGAASPVTELSGPVRDHAGRLLPPGTSVEALIGGTRCGVASVRTEGENFTGYIMSVVGPDAIKECVRGARITFRIDGRPATETYVNTLSAAARGSGGSFPLTQS